MTHEHLFLVQRVVERGRPERQERERALGSERRVLNVAVQRIPPAVRPSSRVPRTMADEVRRLVDVAAVRGPGGSILCRTEPGRKSTGTGRRGAREG